MKAFITGIALGLALSPIAAQAAEAEYQKTCGNAECHQAYPTQLLPAASWKKIIAESEDHRGKNLGLSAEQKETLTAYASANAADDSSHKRSRKIMSSLRGSAPDRITEVPYIREKHTAIDRTKFSRPSVKSPANCAACHPAAAQMEFSKKTVKIPD